MRFVCVILVMIACGGTVSAQTVDRSAILKTDIGQLAEWLDGTYSNGSQTLAGSNYLAEAPPEPDMMPGLIYAHFKRIDAPQVGEFVFYLQWHDRMPIGKIQRQRIWSFRIDEPRNAVTMDFFTIAEPDKWVNLHERPALARTMSLDDLKGYPPGCPLPFRRHIDVFIGEIPDGCLLPSQTRGGSMDLNARVLIGEGQVWYDEGAIHLDTGDVIFDVPVSGAYQFKKIQMVDASETEN